MTAITALAISAQFLFLEQERAEHEGQEYQTTCATGARLSPGIGCSFIFALDEVGTAALGAAAHAAIEIEVLGGYLLLNGGRLPCSLSQPEFVIAIHAPATISVGLLARDLSAAVNAVDREKSIFLREFRSFQSGFMP